MITYLYCSKVRFVAVVFHMIFLQYCPLFDHLKNPKNNQVGFLLLYCLMSF